VRIAAQIAGTLLATCAVIATAIRIGILWERAKWKNKCVDYHRGYEDGTEAERKWWIGFGKQIAEPPRTRRKP
jgi:hypothetical protein